ncbi:aconitate hydratase AcnA [Acidianus sulfidivorans JP7]|uniref:Aconitate hydratase AcnA n=1 Tax=Acidianus sulfidivorans JP7 TaxID=619593 RepID=A0A2U9IN25_9CREN|nr:aconitate hydratase AcnA [Acidianus sulfidivorans]AWR97410.1 aconitate hydratase AcnA [Acidianus sulfidivorans JP7]
MNLENLPYSLRILAINISKNIDEERITKEDLDSILDWKVGKDFAFMPTRVIMQDYTGVPLLVDLAAMRSEIKRRGKDPLIVNPKIQSDLVIDHSVQVDYYGTVYSLELNMKKEFERNYERYTFLKWAQKSFKNLRIIPPGKGIIHQINLEYLSKVIHNDQPEIVIGTDSHTTMINGISVLGWGVGGLEAEAVMLGEPYYAVVPEVIGVRLEGEIKEGVTPTDVVLYLTELLRKKGVVGKYVEFFGPSVSKLSVPDRATISNMAPEYGATVGYFPIDEQTIKYLNATNRDGDYVAKKARELQIYYNEKEEPKYSDIVNVNLNDIEPSIAGPKNPDERIKFGTIKIESKKKGNFIEDGAVVIAAITSCTNTSNPTVMIGAGLLAKKAVERGLRTKPYVKTSLAPGSPVVVKYLKESNLLPYLEALGFDIVGFGCTTCIGNAGPLLKDVENDIKNNNIEAYAVISGNRNFEGRINPLLKGTYLASPILVVAYALYGKIDMNHINPIGYDPNNNPVYLKDIWPSLKEISEFMNLAMNPKFYEQQYSTIFQGDENWEKIDVTSSNTYDWPKSTYIVEPPWFREKQNLEIKKARILLLLGDKITTDHISPAGPIDPNSDAGKYLLSLGVKELNTFGARRGNHEVMLRGGFSNPKLKNYLVDKTGGYTIHFPDRSEGTVYEVAMKYKNENVPLVIIAGKQYGSGSSRDWAAKVTALLGVKAVLAESFERIHRSNLVAMGVAPIEIPSWKDIGIKGDEEISVIFDKLEPRTKVRIIIERGKEKKEVEGLLRADTKAEIKYLTSGGILNYVIDKIT